MAAKSDYYDILGVSKDASASEIKSAYRKQALEWHPDKHQDNKEAAEKRFKEINEAYQILSDDGKRKAYDNYGHSAFSPGGSPAGGGNPFAGGNPFGGGGNWKVYTSGDGGQGFDFGDPFDIFEQFFGGSQFGGRATRVPRYSITIDFMEAVNGVEKSVSINGRTKTIKIPAGVDEGSRIRFADFVLSINVRPSNTFERDGADVYVNLDVPFTLMVLGGEVRVPTVDGEVKLKVRKGTQSGAMLRLRGKGIKQLRGRGRGDQYVKLSVTIPEKLNRDQKSLLDQLKESNL